MSCPFFITLFTSFRTLAGHLCEGTFLIFHVVYVLIGYDYIKLFVYIAHALLQVHMYNQCLVPLRGENGWTASDTNFLEINKAYNKNNKTTQSYRKQVQILQGFQEN